MKWRFYSALALISVALAVYSLSKAGDTPGQAQPEGVWGAAVNGLSCSIRAAKSTYAPGEDVMLDVFLRCDADRGLKVIRPRVYFSYFGDALPLQVAGPAGLCSYTGPMLEPPPPPGENSWIELYRGEITGLSSIYQAPIRIAAKSWSLDRPGVYTIRLRFEQKKNEYYDTKTRMMLPVTAWEGEALSNAITIRVGE